MSICWLKYAWFLVALATLRTATADQMLYVACEGAKAIMSFKINSMTGELTPHAKTDVPSGVGLTTLSPDGKFMYTSGSVEGVSSVTSLRRARDGSLSVIDSANIVGRPAYIQTDNQGRHLLAADYSNGGVTVYRIVDGVYTDQLTDQHPTERTAHCVKLDPSGRFVFVPHTRPNKVLQFRFDAARGTLTPNDPPFVEGPDEDHRYHQPRHYFHHPKLEIGYTSNEFGGGITAWKFDPQSGTLHRMMTLPSLPSDAKEGFYAADIQLTPDGRFAYVSNRDQRQLKPGEAKQDSLAGFSLDPATGEMTLIGHAATPNQPGSFGIDLTGRFVYSAGSSTSTVQAYRIDRGTGRLLDIATYQTGASPGGVLCATVVE